MKFFANKTFLFKLIVCLCLCLALFNFGVSTVSQAEVSWGLSLKGPTAADLGGKLLSPVVDLLLAIGDGIIYVIQKTVMGTDASITIDTGTNIILAVVAAVLSFTAVGRLVKVGTKLVGAVKALKVLAGAAGILKIAVAGVIFAGAYTALNGVFLPKVTLIPTYSISPEELFKGNILLFDVNIFNPKEVWVEVYLPEEDFSSKNSNLANDASPSEAKEDSVIVFSTFQENGNNDQGYIYLYPNLMEEGDSLIVKKTDENGNVSWVTYNKDSTDKTTIKIETNSFVWNRETWNYERGATGSGLGYGWKTEGSPAVNTTGITKTYKSSSTSNSEDSTSQESIDVNNVSKETMKASKWKEINNPQVDEEGNISDEDYEAYKKYKDYKVSYYYYLKDGDSNDESNRVLTSANSSALELKDTTAKWYYAMRNISIVVLMVVLVYMGIRMLTSSVVSEKAKYKQMLGDWCVAICLIFIMQYIMVFANNFTESIVELFSGVADKNLHIVSIDNPDEKLVAALKSAGLQDMISDDESHINVETNLMGKARLLAQEQNGTPQYVGYVICFIVLVFYTIFFTYVYAKRLLYTIFLTIIAPLVAISYPIDKIGDGKSQAFDIWLKEYIFNLIIQPFHLLLYIVLISSAFNLAGNNIIYSLIAIGFMMPAEKFLRKMFGFDKASTPGFLGGAAGAAVAMSAVKGLANFASKGSKKVENVAKNTVRTIDEAGENRGADKGKNVDDLIATINGEKSETDIPITANKNLNEGDYQDAYFDDVYMATSGTGELNGEGQNDVVSGNLPNTVLRENETNPELKTWLDKRPRLKKGIQGAGNFAKESIKLGMPAVGSAAKIAARATGVGLGAALGVAAGNPSDVVRNTSAGAYAGSAIARGIKGRAGDTTSTFSNAIKEQYEDMLKNQFGSQYSEYVKHREDEKFLQDKEKAKLYGEKLNLKSKEEVRLALEDAVKYRQYNITDDKIIIKAMKSDGGNSTNRANAERITAAMLSKKSKVQKDFENVQKSLSEKMDKKYVESVSRKIKEINKDDDLI